MTTNTNVATESSYAYSVVYQEIEAMLVSYLYGIPVSSLETFYEKKFKRSLDYKSIGVETIDELLGKMYENGKVLLYDHPQNKKKSVRLARLPTKSSEIQDMPTESSEIQDMPTKSSEIQDVPMDVYDKIQYIASGYVQGATMSWIEKRYHMDFWRSPDYRFLGVKDFKELIDKMKDEGRVLVYKEPESNETYVMCARLAKSFQKFLRYNVEILIRSHGNVPLSCFEAIYQERFKRKLNYHQYNLTDLDDLCEVLNLVVGEEADSGQKVIKTCNVYNLRKRMK